MYQFTPVSSAMINMNKLAVILIDLQHSFVAGGWKSNFPNCGAQRILSSFDNCNKFLKELPTDVPVLLTQCPFYDLNDRDFHHVVKNVINERGYPVVYKYNTDIMDAEGVTEWMENVMKNNINTILIGGCTITSCVRVSSTSLRNSYPNKLLRFVVDLSLSGARDDNYVKRCNACMDQYMSGGGQLCGKCEEKGQKLKSPVDLAVECIESAGVKVIEKFDVSLLNT